MSLDVEISVSLSVDDREIVDEILSVANKEPLAWQELMVFKKRGVSVYRLRRIILALLAKGELIELKCRLFVTKELLEKTPPKKLREMIVEKIRRLGLRKCGKPIGVPCEKISISITRNGTIIVNVPNTL